MDATLNSYDINKMYLRKKTSRESLKLSANLENSTINQGLRKFMEHKIVANFT